ncbi:hypothetical protein ABBQ38_004652 [Trebouxia sp. C0009 RCD-2024]
MKALHAAMKLLHLEARAHSFKMSVMQALDTLLLMGLYIGGFMCVATILVIVLHSLRYRVWIGLVLPYLCTWGLDVGITKVVDPSVPTIGIGSFLAVALTFVAIAALVVERYHSRKDYGTFTMTSEASGAENPPTTPSVIKSPKTKHEHEHAKIQPNKPADSIMAANDPSTNSELIKSHHREADVREGQSAPIPAKETQTQTKTPTKMTRRQPQA